MKKYRESLSITLLAALVASLVSLIILILLVYTSNPLKMQATELGLLTVLPALLFFIVSIVTLPVVIIPGRKKLYTEGTPQIRGIYEVLLFIAIALLTTIGIDYIYYLIDPSFSQRFATAFRIALSLTEGQTISDTEFSAFYQLPYLVQNFATMMTGLLVASLIAIPLSIYAAKRLSGRYAGN